MSLHFSKLTFCGLQLLVSDDGLSECVLHGHHDLVDKRVLSFEVGGLVKLGKSTSVQPSVHKLFWKTWQPELPPCVDGLQRLVVRKQQNTVNDLKDLVSADKEQPVFHQRKSVNAVDPRSWMLCS